MGVTTCTFHVRLSISHPWELSFSYRYGRNNHTNCVVEDTPRAAPQSGLIAPNAPTTGCPSTHTHQGHSAPKKILVYFIFLPFTCQK